MKKTLIPLGLALMCGAAQADQIQHVKAGDWLIRGGFMDVDPKSDNLSLSSGNLQVEDDTSFTFNVSYFFTDALAVELQLATPFEHDVDLDGAGRVATIDHLPPTLNVQYHFQYGAFKPYVGAGVNYTIIYNENTTGALTGTKLELDDSFGLGVQAGMDYSIGNGWYLNGEIRYIDLDSDASLDGAGLGTVEVDPFTWALNVGKFF